MGIKICLYSPDIFGSFFFFAPQAITERLETLLHFWRVPSFQARLQGWIASLRAFSQAPLIGYGWGTFSTVIPKFNPDPEFLEIRELYVGHAHSELLELAVETGLLGVGTFFWLVIGFLKQGAKLFEKGDGWLGHLRLGLWAGGLAILLDNLANLTLRTVPVGLLFWLFLAITASLAERGVKRWRLPKWERMGLLSLVLLLILGSPILLSYQINQVRSSRALFFGDLEIERDRPRRAIAYYQEAATWDRGNLLALYKLGYQWLKIGDSPSALKCYQKIEDHSPFYPRLHFYKGLALMGEKKYKEAIPELKMARGMENNFDHNFLLAQLNEGKAEEITWLGEALSHSGRTLKLIEERERELQGVGARKKANELSQRLKETKQRVSIAAQRVLLLAKGKENWEIVLLPLRKALQTKPDEPILHRYLGLALYQAQRYGEAAGELEETLRYDPADAEALDGLALCYTLQDKKPEKALQLMRKAISLDSKPIFWRDLGFILYRKGELGEAAVATKKALEGEDKAKTYALLGLISLSQRSGERAQEYMGEAIKETSPDASFQKGLEEVWRGSKPRVNKQEIEKLLYP